MFVLSSLLSLRPPLHLGFNELVVCGNSAAHLEDSRKGAVLDGVSGRVGRVSG